MTELSYLAKLSDVSLSERYAGAKALSHFRSPGVLQGLAFAVSETTEHVYVRLEAAASLARHGDSRGWDFIKRCLADDYLQNRLEAVIVLAEVPHETSSQLLCTVLMDEGENPEIRSGAAWALGERPTRAVLKVLIESFSAVDEGIRIEAARALAKLAADLTPQVLAQFRRSSAQARPGIAWALSRSGRFELDDLIEALRGQDARQWVAYILGTQEQQRYIGAIEKLKLADPEVYFAATVLWKIMSSWVYDLKEYG